MSQVNNTEMTLSQESSHAPTMVTSLGALLVEKLKRLQGSLAAITGLASAVSESELSGSGTVSRTSSLCDESDPQKSPSPHKQAGPSTWHDASLASASEPSPFRLREQHKAVMLATHGVKVRDFAYESRLPPVRAYKPPVVVGPRRLKRKRAEYEEENSEDSELVRAILAKYSVRRTAEEDVLARTIKRRKQLERSKTEPVEESQSQPPTGMPNDSQMDVVVAESQPIDCFYANSPKTPPPSIITLPRSPFNPIQHPRIHFSTPTHRDIEGTPRPSPPRDDHWVSTPIATPAGSFEHPVPSTTITHTTHTPSTSHDPFAMNVAYTNGFLARPSPSPLRRTFSRNLSRKVSTAKLSRSPSLRQLQATISRSRVSMTPRRLSNSSLTSLNLAQVLPQPRYFLRERTRPASPPRPSPRKPRSSYSKSAMKPTGKAKILPKPKPAPTALRRSTRKAGIC